MHDCDDAEALRLLGGWLARWRVSLGVSQRKLAWQAGISQGGLSRVERGLQACGARRLARLLIALDLLSPAGPDGSAVPPPLRPARVDRGVAAWGINRIDPD